MDEKTVTIRRSVFGWSAYENDDMYQLLGSHESLDVLTSYLLRLGISEFMVKMLPEERTEPLPEPEKKAKPRRRLGAGGDAT